jgi:hypothetical protein
VTDRDVPRRERRDQQLSGAEVLVRRPQASPVPGVPKTPALAVFETAPHLLLVVAPDGHWIELPRLVAPFTHSSVTAACRAAGAPFAITRSVPDPWVKAAKDAKAAANAAQAQREALQIQMLKGSVDPRVRDRAEAVERFHALAEAHLKARRALEDAKRRAAKGEILDADLAALAENEQAVRKELGAANAQLAAINAARKADGQAQSKRLNRQFIDCAREMLDPESFQAIWEAAHGDEDEEEAP